MRVAVADDHIRKLRHASVLGRRYGWLAIVLLDLGGCASSPGTVPSYMAIGSLPKPASAKTHPAAPHLVVTTAAVPKPQPVAAPAGPVAIPDMPALRPTLSSVARPWTSAAFARPVKSDKMAKIQSDEALGISSRIPA